MRGRIGLLMNSSSIGSTARIGRTARCAFSSSSSSSGGDGSGGGRGRGRGTSDSPKYNFIAGKTGSNDNGFHDSDDQSSGRGHGRGKPLPSTPYLPSYNSFVAPDPPTQQPGLSRGRGGPIQQPSEAGNEPKKPIFLKKDESTGDNSEADLVASEPWPPIGEKNLPDNILNVLSGTGRGKPERKPVSETTVKEENRHLRQRQAAPAAPGAGRGGERVQKSDVTSGNAGASARPKLGREEAVRRAVGILAKGDDGLEGGPAERGGGRTRRGTKSIDDSDDEEDDEDDEDDLDDIDDAPVGDDVDGERLAKELGPSVMADLTEEFEELCDEVLPDLEADEYLEAFDTNLKIELEPEYLMGDFESNPDIHEIPPIPLRDALEKMKPFLMAYEGIENQEEWEEIMKETMERVPLLKEIVDHYCGPDRVTAKQQHEELQRVAKTIPDSVPDSVKRFTDRAVLSLQSNPGWGFHRKCQFMDKLADEVSKSQK